MDLVKSEDNIQQHQDQGNTWTNPWCLLILHRPTAYSRSTPGTYYVGLMSVIYKLHVFAHHPLDQLFILHLTFAQQLALMSFTRSDNWRVFKHRFDPLLLRHH